MDTSKLDKLAARLRENAPLQGDEGARISLGVDLVYADAFHDLSPLVLQESFSQEEILYAGSRPHPSQSLAAAWAAKEAFFKALGCGMASGVIRPHEITLRHDHRGAPRLAFSPEVAERLGFAPHDVRVSVTHSRELAVAVVLLPRGAPGASPMAATGGVKNYEKTREDTLALLAGLQAAEAPPPPLFEAEGPAVAELRARAASDPELAPVLTLAQRCGIEIRVVSPHPEALENLDSAMESNDFRKLAPYAQLHFLAMTLDRDIYEGLGTDVPLSEGARGVVLVNRGLLEGPEAEGRELLLRSELWHEAVHFESPGFNPGQLVEEWFREAAGLARQVSFLARARGDQRARAEGLVTDTLEGNPVLASFDLKMSDGSTRRIASKTFLVLERELAAVHKHFGTLTPDGMNPALFRLVDRFLADGALFLPQEGTVTDQGLVEILRFLTRQDKDFRRQAKDKVGHQTQELIPPAGAATKVREVMGRTEELLAGRVEPSFPEPVLRQAEEREGPGAEEEVVAADPFDRERRRRAEALAITPARFLWPRFSVLVRPDDNLGKAASMGEAVLDLRRERVSTEEMAEVRASSLRAAVAFVSSERSLSLRLSRRLDEALQEVRQFLPEMKGGLRSVVLEASRPEDIWLMDDELTELEEVLGLPLGHVGIQVVLETAGAVMEGERLATCTPRISAMELGATLSAQMGWVFAPREGEARPDALARRLVEAERALNPARERMILICRVHRLPLVRGPLPLEEDLPLGRSMVSLLESYNGVRLAGTAQLGLLPSTVVVPGVMKRLESLDGAALGHPPEDPAASYRLEEDLRVLEGAVAAQALRGDSLERYWRARWRLLYDEGVPATISIPSRTLPQVLLDRAREFNERRFLYRAERVDREGKTHSIRAEVPFLDILATTAFRVSRALQSMGIGRGTRVGLSTSNTLAHVASFQALGLLGAVMVPLDPTKGHLADRLFRDAQIELLIFDGGDSRDDPELHHSRLMAWAREGGLDQDAAFWEELRRSRRRMEGPESSPTLESLLRLLPPQRRVPFQALWESKLDVSRKFAETLVHVPSLRAVVLTRIEDFCPGAVPSPLTDEVSELAKALGAEVRVEQLHELVEGLSAEPFSSEVFPYDLLALPYTGGTTTGISKAVAHTHHTMLALGLQRGFTMIPDGRDTRYVVATTLPFTHTYGFATGVLTPVLTGADALVVPNTGPRYLPLIAEALVKDEVSVLFSSPSALSTLARLIPETAQLSHLRRIASSGDTLTPAVTDIWQERFGLTPCSGYGSTETPSSLMNPQRTNRAGTEGIPVPNVEARVVDRATGEALPPGRPGLIQIRGPHVSVGYLDRPEENARVMRPGHWWQKDDIFEMDSEGYFIFRGRADDMFTVQELNVYPDAVERALLTIPGVAEAGIIGVFDEALGTNRVKAFVVPQPGAELTPEEVTEAARPLLEAHEVPTMVEIVEDLTRSNFGKLARSALRRGEEERRREEGPEEGEAMPLPEGLVAGEVALVFPTAGSHWAGMGADLEIFDDHRRRVDRAEEALERLGVTRGDLRRLMGGQGQAERVQVDGGWGWRGDFPLSVAAQTVVSISLAEAFLAKYGDPRAVVGESMGEAAAACVCGALELEEAVVLAYRWARALQEASDALGLRMAVVENLTAEALAEVSGPLKAQVVITEAPTLHVVALPTERLGELEAGVGAVGGRILVSNNPCAAHEPRLRQQGRVWEEYKRFLGGLAFREPRLPLLSTLRPGGRLEAAEAVRDGLMETVFTPVRWSEAMVRLVQGGARGLFQLGSQGSAYALERLADEEPALADVRIESVGTLAGIDMLDAPRGRCWDGEAVEVGPTLIRALARASGDRNLYHLDREYARRTRYGAVILHGVGTQALALAEVGRRFPAMEVTWAEVPTFLHAVREGDRVRPVVEVMDHERGGEVWVRIWALNGWNDILLEGEARLSSRGRAHHGAESIDLEAYARDVEPFEERPAPSFREGEEGTFSFTLDWDRLAATRRLFPGGESSFAITLGVELLSFASASFAPGYVLTGTQVSDVRRALAEWRIGLERVGVGREELKGALDRASDTEGLLEALPLAGRAGRAFGKAVTLTMRQAMDWFLARGSERLWASWDRALEPLEVGETLTLRTHLEKVEGSRPERIIRIGVEVLDSRGRLLYLGKVNKVEAPPQEEGERKGEEQVLAETLVQQKIINVFPVTRPRDAENSAADPAVNAALVDLEDAVSPTMRREARPRAVEMVGRVRRHSPPAKRGLVVALQTARARLRNAPLSDFLLDPRVRDFETMMARMEFRKGGEEDFRRAMKGPHQRLLRTYLSDICTRRALLDSVGHLDFTGKVLKMRPNNVRTDAAAADYHEVIRHVGNRVDALTIPKTRFPEEIVTIDRVLTAIELSQGWPAGRLKLELLIENPQAVEHIAAIAAASPRTISLIYGHVDYTAATGGWDQNRQFEYQRYAKRRTVEAAHDNGQIAIDAITPLISEALAKADAERSVAMGFDGKWSIHLEHVMGIRQASFPPPRLSLRPHRGPEEFPDGPFDLGELWRMAREGIALVSTAPFEARRRLVDLRAMLRVGPEGLISLDLDAEALVMVGMGRSPDDRLVNRLRELGARAAVVLPPDAGPETFRMARDIAPNLVLEATPEGPSLTPEAVRGAAEGFRGGRILLSLTGEKEVRKALALASASEQVVGLINTVAPVSSWEIGGAVVNAASALGIDALQGLVTDEGDWRKMAFWAAHMGVRGQVTDDRDRLEGLRQSYTPSQDLIAEALTIVERYYKAERIENLGAIPYEYTYLQEKPMRGLVDAATAKIYREVINRAAELALLREEQREIRRAYVLRWRWNDSGEEVDFTRWRWVPGKENGIELREEPQRQATMGSEPGQFSRAEEIF